MAFQAAARRYYEQMGQIEPVPEPTAVEQALQTVYGPLENGFAAIGLENHLLRFGVVTTIATAVLFYWKPSFAFAHLQGPKVSGAIAKRWKLYGATAEQIEQAPELYTWVPWWLAAFGIGAATALLV